MRYLHSLSLLLLLVLIYACGHDDDAPSFELDRVAVQAVLDQNLAALPQGWPAGDDCDGLLWSGLAQAAGHESDLLTARQEDGKWLRRPLAYGNCWEAGEAGSEISRDMYVGLAASLPTTLAVEALAYARAHDSVMGEGELSRTKWTTNIYGLYERVAGEGSDTLVILFPVKEDYEKHLQLIIIQTYRRAAGGLPKHLTNFAGGLARELTTDALAQAVACRSGHPQFCERAQELIVDPAYVCPTYVRGPVTACAIHKAYVASVLL